MKGSLIRRAALAAVILTTLVSISLATVRAAEELHVKGTVTRSRQPVRSVWVILFQNDEEKGRSLTGDDGKYYIGDLYAGEYTVVVKQGSHSLFEGRVKLPEERIYNVQLTRR